MLIAVLPRSTLSAIVAASSLLAAVPAAAQSIRSVAEAETRLRDMLLNVPPGAPDPRGSGAVQIDPLPSGIGSRGEATAFEREFVGEWRRENGVLRITEQRGAAGVWVYATARGPEGTEYQMGARLRALGQTELQGGWEHLNGDFQGGSWRLRRSGDELTLEGFYATPRQAVFDFRRSEGPADPASPPAPTPPPPATPPAWPPPGTSSQPNSQPPGPPAPSAFQPLNRVDVRIDRVVVARGYPTHQVHAFVTVKNTSAVPQYFTSGFVKVVLADADGVSWERSQPYRASGEPAELFGSTPVIQPGGELRVRFVFLPEADAQLTSITLSEGGKRAQFPVSGL